MSKIKKITARQILDSRGNPTIEATIQSNNFKAIAKVPSGASTGIHEAIELRDNNTSEYNGKGVKKSVNKINNTINKLLQNQDSKKQKQIDELMIKKDNTPNKARLGANSILAVSMANIRLAAKENKIELYKQIQKINKTKTLKLPIPFANVINGGVHAGNKLEFQEFMIVPIKAKSFKEATKMVTETYHTLKIIIEKKYGKSATAVGDEGGFAPNINSAEEALDLLTEAIKKAKYTNKIKIAMDVAASEIYNKDNRTYTKKNLTAKKLETYYIKLINKYPIISIEDPFDQDDFIAWKSITSNPIVKKKGIQIVGDDLTVSNPARIQLAIDQKLCNALLLKVNQIGTVTEALAAAQIATKSKWNVMVSHRSGETEDTFIADLAVGLGCGQLKLGAPARSERTAKYNRILEIEDTAKVVKLDKFV